MLPKYEDAKGLRDLNYKSSFLTQLNNSDSKFNCYNKYFSLAGDYFFGRSDIVVSVNKISRIQVHNTKYSFGSIVNDWHHFNYYKNLDDKLLDALDTARHSLNF
ncbi:hypothetical protein ACKA06_16340 [Rossellomorea oryzaecorticis]|uniref:Uncharacterized protein n=1 Tax=Rossellomorea oryzaecorticis TaxID=1396505 RepID=A0ABW8VSK5_9BACI